MSKIKPTGYLIIILGLFFVITPKLIDAFTFQTVCQPPLTTFSDGSPTFDVSFPPGGGTTCDTIADCPKISFPALGTVYSIKMDFELSNPATEIGTPYIWIPNTNSGSVAQLRTTNGELVKLYQNGVGDIPAGTFSLHSRITVIPGGDVYIANRGNTMITRLTPKPAPAEDYQYGGQFNVGKNYVRTVTFDRDGNIWAATCSNTTGGPDRIRVFCGNATCGGLGTVIDTLDNGKCHYGGIGDMYGFVWTVGGGQIRSYYLNSGSITEKDNAGVAGSYGIGIDNDTNLWVGRRGPGGGVYKVTRDAAGNILFVNFSASGIADNTGVAADGVNNVWVAGWGSGQVSRFNTNGVILQNQVSGGNPHGVAIDFDNNAWVVNYNGGSPGAISNPSGCGGNGTVSKFDSSGNWIATYRTCGNNPYNYSDMTGFRSVPKVLNFSGTSIPLSLTGTFEVCTDGTITCSDAAPFAAITAFLSTCIPDEFGNCEIPLEIFSMQAGDYTLSNLEVIYGKQVPVTTGGLIPCGREWNDPDTEIKTVNNLNNYLHLTKTMV